jgi:hypothetical protein
MVERKIIYQLERHFSSQLPLNFPGMMCHQGKLNKSIAYEEIPAVSNSEDLLVGKII